MILLDTNVLVHYLKGRESVVSRLKAENPRNLAIPSIVAFEIEYGLLRVESAGWRAVVSGLLDALDQIPFDNEAAVESARIRIDLKTRGLMIGPMDLLIAGTALSRGATLVTNNIQEFSRVKGLRLSDWTVES
jgi:tRNA(fMet)-specific endonuclease VapC